ncbi:MAG: hemin uptake protein HemP [Thiotrichales bacterium]
MKSHSDNSANGAEFHAEAPDHAIQTDLDALAHARVYSTAELFGADAEIVIDHQGQTYRLRITRQNKLILTK